PRGGAALVAAPGRRRPLWRRPGARLWLLAGAAASATTAAWVVNLRQRLPMTPFQGRGLADAVGLVPFSLRAAVGVFGSTDIIPPLGLHLAWAAAVLVVMVAGLRRARPLTVLLSLGLCL